jgi:protein-disulfide isomerase
MSCNLRPGQRSHVIHSDGIQHGFALIRRWLHANRLANKVMLTQSQELTVTDATNRPQSSMLRRTAIAVLGLGLIAGGLAVTSHTVFADAKGPAEVPVDELMKAGDLPELAIGPADAKVTIVEYASMTCGHCKTFHTGTYPQLKTKYVDTSKVRFVFREFPLDPRAFAASMLARCAGGDKTLPMVSALFETQGDWAFVKENPTPKLFEVAKQAGFTQESFDKCLTDQALLDKLTAARTRASEVFGVSSTPTFFINGKRLTESPTIEGFAKVLEPLLK